MQVTFFNAQRPPPRAHRQCKATNAVSSSPKSQFTGNAANHPIAFNMRTHRTNTVAEKKVCSSRQRSLNKTILHAGLLVAACHDIYTP